MPWYAGETKSDRVGAALAIHDFDTLLALTPKNAAYLAGRCNDIATLWCVPGLFSVAVGRSGTLAVITPDFGGDPRLPHPCAHFVDRIWKVARRIDRSSNPEPRTPNGVAFVHRSGVDG